jgi:ribosomal protein L11 methyltransferase
LAEWPALDLRFRPAPESEAPWERLAADLDDFHPTAIHEQEDGAAWRVFFAGRAESDAAAAHLGCTFGAALQISALDVPDEDWARRSQQNLRAVVVDGLIVAPPWDVPRDGRFPVIVIEPSMGFGTGHHETTRLCLRLLQRLELRGARVVDVGTGSGVLALAAWKLGASDISAVDPDADALENARANIARNGAGAAVDVIPDQLASLRLPPADVVLANLTGAVIVQHASRLRSLIGGEGYLIVSGFAPADVRVIEVAFKGLHVVAEETEGEWAAICFRGSNP